MIRYCNHCEKEFDFKIKSMKELENLTCPKCGQKVEKESRKPVDEESKEGVANAISSAYGWMIYAIYSCMFVFSIVGIYAYLRNKDGLLYIASLLMILVGLFWYGSFLLCGVFLALGTGIGFLIFHTLKGACFGLLIGSIVWQLVRFCFQRFLGALIHAGRS